MLKILTNGGVMTALSSRSGRAIAIFLNFYVSLGTTAMFSTGGEKCYVRFVDNS